MTHIVQRGETLFRIARKYNLTLSELQRLNDLRSNDAIRVGQALKVKEEASLENNILSTKAYTVASGDSLYSIANKFSISLDKLKKLNQLHHSSSIYVGQKLFVKEEPKPTEHERGIVAKESELYTVKRGDSLFGISSKFGLRVSKLLEINGLDTQSSIFPGQQLRIKEISEEKVIESALTYTVKPGDSLYGIAIKKGLSLSQLKELNGIDGAGQISPGQKLILSKESSAIPEEQPQPKIKAELRPKYYVVQRGDSLFSIATKHGLTILEIREFNHLSKQSTIFPGQKLIVSQSSQLTGNETKNPVFYVVQRGDSLFGIANKHGLSRDELLKLNNLSSAATIFPGQRIRIASDKPLHPETEPQAPESLPSNRKTKKYVVKKGDWLSKIARRHNVSTDEIVDYNDLSSTKIKIGEVLYIPKPNQVPVPRHLRKTARKIRKARRIYDLAYENGEDLFEYGLKGALGKVDRMYPEDVDKVQKRLVELGLLEKDHGEDPFVLQHKLGTRPLWYESIPKTIASIEACQEKFQVPFWQEEPKRHDILEGVTYFEGVISPSDLTQRVLEEYTEYTLTVPHPYEKKETIEATFNNFHISRHTVDYRGVSYQGVSNPDIPMELFASLGLDETLAQAVKYVSAHEGNFDAINTYDKAIFSYGFIQFAGAGGGLGAVMAKMKVKEEKLFDEYFVSCGIDVEPIYSGSKIVAGELKVFDLNNSDGVFIKTGEAAEKAIALDKELYGPFIRAGHRLEFIACQIEAAVEGYVKPALKIKTDILAGDMDLREIPLTEIICSPMGLGLMIDLTVNQWVNRTREVFKAAIEKVALIDQLDTPELLVTIDELKVIEAIVQDAGALDDRIAKRGTSFLLSSLSPNKGDADLSGMIA